MKGAAERGKNTPSYLPRAKQKLFSSRTFVFLLVHRKCGKTEKKKEKKKKRKTKLEESSENMHKGSHHLQLSNAPKKEECL